MERLLKRFLDYVQIDTAADEEAGTIPSSSGQKVLAQKLALELEELGASNICIDQYFCVTATIPSNVKSGKKVPSIGFIAHLDTAPEFPGNDVKPQVFANYDGGMITINKEQGIFLSSEKTPELSRYLGHDLVTSDGTTLLGADDKAGIAIIMDVLEQLQRHPEIEHGKVCVAFTPDEELSQGGISVFDIQKFGADFAYTVDGDGIGEFNHETFNAIDVTVDFSGISIHTGEAKNRMVNPLILANEFMSSLPREEAPETTEGYEGFYHIYSMKGDTDSAKVSILLRDFDRSNMENRVAFVKDLAKKINQKYGEGGKEFVTVTLSVEYYNMNDFMEGNEHVAETALQAYRLCGLEPKIAPIRGGTDGSTLSKNGLITPNLFLGGHNYHSAFEFVSVNAMKKSGEVILKILELYADKSS